MDLCGFLSPGGKFTECAPWDHINEAGQIIKREFKKEIYGLQAEDFLFDNGYVVFYSRGSAYRFFSKNGLQVLSEEQRDFMISNLSNANNDDQKKDMNDILCYDQDLRVDKELGVLKIRCASNFGG